MANETRTDSEGSASVTATKAVAHHTTGDAQHSQVAVREGLAGVVVARTEISRVDGESGTLSYRGYDIGQLARHATFEETVYLLWNGQLPNSEELAAFSQSLASKREIDEKVRRILTILPKDVEPMDALRTAVSALSSSDADDGNRAPEATIERAKSLVAKFPTIVTSYYRHCHGLPPISPNPDLGHAANFLYMIHGHTPTELEARVMDVIMLLMAEHGFNASTFAARVTAATLSDIYSAITSALGTLKGPLHGGANRRAMEMMLEIGDLDNVEPYISNALARKQRIMGFGHRVYKKAADPRSMYLRDRLYELCAARGDFHFYELATAIADTVKEQKRLYPNVDFYTAPLLYLLSIPLELFTPVFAISRIPGWSAHVMEQYANNRLIRPLATYIGPRHRVYRPIADRD